jgi:hypothetical protein
VEVRHERRARSEEAIEDIREDVAEGDEPSGDEREFLEAEKVDVPRGTPPVEPEDW